MQTEEQVRSTLLALVEERDADGVARFGDEIATNGHANPRMNLAIGQALADCGDTARAVAWYERISPGDKPYNFSRAQMARLFNGAREFERVLELTDAFGDDEITDPLAVARVRALIGLDRRDDALAFAERLEVGRPESAMLLEAAADAALGPRGWAGALAFLDRAVNVSPEPRLRFRRAVALFQLDRLDECLVSLGEVAAIKDFSLKAQQYIVRIHQRRRDSERTFSACQELLSQDPSNEFGHETLIRHYIEQNDFVGVRSSFVNAHFFHPEKFPKALLDFLVLERKGRLADALKPFESGELGEQLSESLKERIATSFYYSGQYDRSRQLGKSIADDERRALMNVKLDIALGATPDLAELPKNREGRIAQALALYQQGRFAECVETLDSVSIGEEGALSLRNLRNLALTGRILPDELYAASVGAPRSPGPLPIVQLLWVGSALSKIELLSIRSFLACGHEVHFYSYDRDIVVPPGCVVRDAGEILPETEIFAHSSRTGRSKGSLAGFADLFRWKLIYERGGAWADCDVVCLTPMDATRVVSTELARLGTFVVPAVTNCFFAAPPGEPAFLQAFEQAKGLERGALLWGEIGIHKMSDIVAQEQWRDRLTSPSDICPIPSFRIVDAIYGKFDVDAVIEKTGCRAVHLYNEVMRMVKFNKDGVFPKRGLLDILDTRVTKLEEGRK